MSFDPRIKLVKVDENPTATAGRQLVVAQATLVDELAQPPHRDVRAVFWNVNERHEVPFWVQCLAHAGK